MNNNNILNKVLSKKNFVNKKILMNEKISIIGYGPQGRNQALNLIDNGYDIKIGLRKNGKSWFKAKSDGFIENKNLFSIDEAVYKGTIIKYLLSDKGQIDQWKNVKENLHENNTLYFSHGLNLVYKNETKIFPPNYIDIIMIAPKCPGNKVREYFLNKKGFNSSLAIHQDYTKSAKEKCEALGFEIGSNYLFETTFEKETYSDLTGERCVLMGLIQAAFKSQYEVLIENGHSKIEAYNETVEEALCYLYPMINEKGMDWMYENCSTTAQIGALKWSKRFEKIIKPEIEKCYKDVKCGIEIKEVLENNILKKKKDIEEIKGHDIWKIHKMIKKL